MLEITAQRANYISQHTEKESIQFLIDKITKEITEGITLAALNNQFHYTYTFTLDIYDYITPEQIKDIIIPIEQELSTSKFHYKTVISRVPYMPIELHEIHITWGENADTILSNIS